MKRIICLCCLLPLLLFSGCSNTPGYEQTPETEKALETYYAAVKESVAQTEGTVVIDIRMKDTVVSKKDSTEKYEYSYSVSDGKESFDYLCKDDEGKLISHVATNEEGRVIDLLTGEETSDFNGYFNHQKNPISTLQLFRMDSNYKVQDSTISAIKMEQTEGDTLIKVSFHPDKLTGLSIKNTNGLNRNITSHERIYTIREGKIAKIEIYDRENAHYQNETGTIDTDTIVEVSYP